MTALTDDEANRYGFRWDHIDVTRSAEIDRGTGPTKVLTIHVNGTERLVIYVSPTGRSVRIFDQHSRELKPERPTTA